MHDVFQTDRITITRFSVVVLLLLIFQLEAFSQSKTTNVYITRTGEKYHVEGCRYLSKSSIEVTLDKALKGGYTACSVCKPSNKSRASSPQDGRSGLTESVNQRQATTSSNSVQCNTLTKAGSQCKRTTKDASGKCWQHLEK